MSADRQSRVDRIADLERQRKALPWASSEAACLTEAIEAVWAEPLSEWEVMCPSWGTPCGDADCIAKGCIEERDLS